MPIEISLSIDKMRVHILKFEKALQLIAVAFKMYTIFFSHHFVTLSCKMCECVNCPTKKKAILQNYPTRIGKKNPRKKINCSNMIEVFRFC